MSAVNVTIYTDGSTEPNPGESGFAAVMVAHDENGVEVARKIVHGYEAQSTNQRAEISACIIGLEALTKPSVVTIVTDSQYVVRTMQGEWSAKSNTDLWQRLDAVSAKHQVTWQWVRGHNGHPGNERAHTESVRAMRLKGQVESRKKAGNSSD